ncbi:SDR family NAD(P)-dependent oxidoreductase [Roseomonas sp. CCTCC AB2023176]|uniref:SDR family NAD(P)-dependent oxidoreductase n=1 Tax=Roseomonas sp. CCTCC AB2023176 TaxID=3342640 RepID=UPI0035DDBD79
MSEFDGKRVLITGAAGIYGRWLAAAFAKAGARLLLSDNRPDALTRTVADLSLRDTLTHATELLDDASIADLAATVAREWGAPDIVLNNAGIYPGKPLLETEAADYDAMFGINCRAPFLIARDMGRLMMAQGVRGNIVNIGSGASRKMRPSRVLYCTSKTTLERLTKGFALELAEHGIRVNLVEPGFAAGSEVTPLSEEHIRTTTASIPLGRLTAPEDAANAVMFLCSSRASYITGTVLAVEGGNSLRA